MTPTPHLQWEERFAIEFPNLADEKVVARPHNEKDEKSAAILTQFMRNEAKRLKQFIASLLQERDKMASRYGNDRYNEGKQEGATQERERITKILKREIESEKKIMRSEVHEAVVGAHHRSDAITDALKKIGEKI